MCGYGIRNIITRDGRGEVASERENGVEGHGGWVRES
jgi:hypothetical protein